MHRVELRVDLWPLVITTLPERLEEEPLERFLASFDVTVLGRGERFILVTDAMRMQYAPHARVRQRVAAWMEKSTDVGKRYNLGFALATSSILVRGAMTAVNWISPTAVPATYEPDLASAVRWAVARLDVAGVPVHERILAYVDDLGAQRVTVSGA